MNLARCMLCPIFCFLESCNISFHPPASSFVHKTSALGSLHPTPFLSFSCMQACVSSGRLRLVLWDDLALPEMSLHAPAYADHYAHQALQVWGSGTGVGVTLFQMAMGATLFLLTVQSSISSATK